MALRLNKIFTWIVKNGLNMADKSTNKIQFRQMEKSIQKISIITTYWLW